MAVWVGPVGSEWVAWKPGVWEQAVTVAPDDGGRRLLVLDEPAQWYRRRHGYYIFKKQKQSKMAGCSWPVNS